jgi:predicted RNase H-like HicB family nuclease
VTAYFALIHKTKRSDFGVSFPDFPGCISAGRSLDEARRMAAEALELHVEGLAEDGHTLPAPTSLEAIMANRANRGAVAIVVDAPGALTHAVRVNITIPANDLRRIDDFARRRGMTRSGFLLRAAKEAVQRTPAQAPAPKAVNPRARARRSA